MLFQQSCLAMGRSRILRLQQQCQWLNQYESKAKASSALQHYNATPPRGENICHWPLHEIAPFLTLKCSAGGFMKMIQAQERHVWRGQHSLKPVFFRKNKEVLRVNWLLRNRELDDRLQEFKCTFMSLDLLQEDWTTSKKALQHRWKSSTW